MKILHVLTSARAEGTPKLVLDWLSIDEHDQSVLFLTERGELLEEFTSRTKVYTNNDFEPSLKSGLKITSLVKRVCKEFEPDLVIAWPTGHSQWIHLGSSMAGVKKKITHIGNPPGETFFGRYIATAITFWMSYFLNVKFIACSEYVKNETQKIKLIPQTLYRVYNSFAIQSFASGQAKEDKVCMIGYMEAVRDHSSLLESWKLINQRLPKTELRLVGDGSLRHELELFVSRGNIKNVIFLGRKESVKVELERAKVYVLSTRKEGFGITLLEALAAGCRVVCTDLPATREVLEAGKWGELVPLKDPEALAAAIERAMQLPKLTEIEMENRVDYLTLFSVEKMIRSYNAIAHA